MSATPKLVVNGRFKQQNLTGVQRFAAEITAALQQQLAGQISILEPSGRRHGQAWEQLDLPRRTMGGFLLNLGNTAPLSLRRQLIVIHDAGVFSTPDVYSRKFRLWYKTMQALLARRGVPIVTVSEFSRGEICRYLRVAPSGIHVIGEGSDHMARIEADEDALATHGLAAGRYVLVVGTLARHKNLSALGLLAKALARENITLAITGAFGAAAFSGTSPLPEPARYLGRVSDGALKSLYQSAACFVFPSLYEGFGLPAVEAMASGCPVIAADIPSLRECCGAAAIYFNPASPEDIAAKVLAVLHDPGRQQWLRAAGLREAGRHNWAASAAALYRIAQSIITRSHEKPDDVKGCGIEGCDRA